MNATASPARMVRRPRVELIGREIDRRVAKGRPTSLRQKARLLDVPPSSLCRILNGHRPPSAEFVIGLVRLLHPEIAIDRYFAG